MIKLTAILLIASGFAFSGYCIASFQRKRVEALGEIVMMLSAMQTRLRYDCLPVGSLLKAAEENARGENLGFVSVCREKTERGEAFPKAWRESIENSGELCRLIRNVLPSLIRLGEELGTTDLEGQLSCCGYYERIFCDELKEREEQNKKYSKLYPALGAMLGIWAAILII